MKSIAAIWALAHVAAAQTVEQLRVSEISELYKLDGKEPNSKVFFKVRVEGLGVEDNLMIKLVTPDRFSDPDLFISQQNTHPDSPGNSEIMCASNGGDACTVPRSKLNENSWVYAGVVCKSNCAFRVYPSILGKIELKNNREERLDFRDNESKLFKFRVPSKSGVGGSLEERISSITILARPLFKSRDFKQSSLILAAAANSEITAGTSLQSVRSEPVWDNSQVVQLFEGGE